MNRRDFCRRALAAAFGAFLTMPETVNGAELAIPDPPRTKPGRKPKLTPEVHKGICDMVRLGVPPRLAAVKVNVSPKTLDEWIARGEKRHCSRASDWPYAAFAADLERAKGEFIARKVGQIEQAARGGQVLAERTVTRTRKDGTTETTREVRYTEADWRAAAWQAERAAEEFRPPEKVSEPPHQPGEDEVIVRVLGPGLSLSDL
jgi:hypothetical protein